MARKTAEAPIDALKAKRDEFATANLAIVAEIIELEKRGAVSHARVDEFDDKIEDAARKLFNGTAHLLEPKRRGRSSLDDRLKELWQQKAAVNRAEELAGKRLDVLLAEEAAKRAAEIAPEWQSAQRQRVLVVVSLLCLNKQITEMHESVGDAASLPLYQFHANRLLGRGEGQPGSNGHLANQLVAEALRLGLVSKKDIDDNV